MSGLFFDVQYVISLQTHILKPVAKISWSILDILGPFAFSVFLFCHPFGGRDSPKKARTPEELC